MQKNMGDGQMEKLVAGMKECLQTKQELEAKHFGALRGRWRNNGGYMINIKNLKVGQTLYLVRKGYEGNVHKEELDRVLEVKVVKAGRRYVTVDTSITTKTFDYEEDFKVYYGYGYKQMKEGLYLCVQDYLDELTKEDLLKEVRVFFDTYNSREYELISLEDLETINKIIKKYKLR